MSSLTNFPTPTSAPIPRRRPALIPFTTDLALATGIYTRARAWSNDVVDEEFRKDLFLWVNAPDETTSLKPVDEPSSPIGCELRERGWCC